MKGLVAFAKQQKNGFKPIVLFFLLYPVARALSSALVTSEATLTLFNLTLPLFTALLVLYSLRALPALGAFLLYSASVSPVVEFSGDTAMVISAVVSYFCYFGTARGRGSVSYGRSGLILPRLLWLTCFNALFATALQLILPSPAFVPGADWFTLQNLIHLQGMLNSCLVGIPLCYLVLRCCHRPEWCLRYLKQCQLLLRESTRPIFLIVWLLLLITAVSALILQQAARPLLTEYTMLLLLSLVLWGMQFIGQKIISPLWGCLLILFGKHIDDYSLLTVYNLDKQLARLAIMSAMVFVLSLAIVVIRVLVYRNHGHLRKIRSSGLTEPNTGLPSLLALKKDLNQYPECCLCLIYCPELWKLMQMHGLNIRFAYVLALTRHLRTQLGRDEKIYYSPGYGVVLRLRANNEQRIRNLYLKMDYFRFSWGHHQLGLHCGMGYTDESIRPDELIFMARELGHAVSRSLISDQPERVIETDKVTDAEITCATEIRYLLQWAIDQRAFVLVAQPIISTQQEETYHEILIRIRKPDGTLLYPDAFLPASHSAGLSALLDLAVIEQTFCFIHSTADTQPNQRYAINLMPDTLSKKHFIHQVSDLLQRYQVAPTAIIFEVIETDILDNKLVIDNIQALRSLGCKIAIDDFGTGYASHSRLKHIDADILKIDGSFVKNILKSEFDHYTVSSFCHAAKIRNMQVVAEYVETAEIQQELINIGVGWLQGYHTGKPQPVSQL